MGGAGGAGVGAGAGAGAGDSPGPASRVVSRAASREIPGSPRGGREGVPASPLVALRGGGGGGGGGGGSPGGGGGARVGANARPPLVAGSLADLTLCAVGVLATLAAYGVLQERLMQRPYGPRGDIFAFPTFLIFCNRGLTTVFAGAALLCSGQRLQARAPLQAYAGVAACNSVATYSQFALLKWLSFVAATLAKSARPVPVMLWGIALQGASYGAADWLAAGAVLGGSLLFGLSGDLLAPAAAEAAAAARAGGVSGSGSGFGSAAGNPLIFSPLAIAAYLGFDGLTSTLQERLFRAHEQPPLAMAFHTGRWAMLYTLVAGLVSGEFPGAVDFAQRHPALLRDVLLLAASVASSQYFILRTIRNHGALTFAFVMTTRQAVSVGLSWVVFPKSLPPGQVAGVAVCFAGLYGRCYLQVHRTRLRRQALSPSSPADSLPSPVGRKA